MKLFFLILAFIPFISDAQNVSDKPLLAGNDYYKKQKFIQAEQEYAKVSGNDPQHLVARFNQGNALYKQDKKVEAVQIFADITGKTNTPDLKSRAWYNKAVILTSQSNLEESIEAYKHALRNNPNDKEARENLQKALLELKKKKEERKKEDQQQQKKEQQKKQSSPKMQPKEADQRLRLLQQKEKEVQQRVQKEKSKSGGIGEKDW